MPLGILGKVLRVYIFANWDILHIVLMSSSSLLMLMLIIMMLECSVDIFVDEKRDYCSW